MRWLVLVAIVLLLAGPPAPGAAFDDDFGDRGWIPEPPSWEAPTWEAPTWDAPVWEPPSPSEPEWDPSPSGWSEPGPDSAPLWEPALVDYYVPEPAPEPAGLYLVNEVYVRDTVVVDGPLTTYSTVTASDTPGTYARELGAVVTGDASVYDGASVNGRLQLSDGRPVAGSYYETFVLTAAGFVSIGITFFQDDAELARLARIDPREIGVSSGPPAVLGGAVLPPSAAAPGTPSGSGPGGDARPDPAAGEPGSARSPDVRTGVLTGGGLRAASAVETLRGRLIALSPVALVDGAPATTLTWRVTPGPAIAARVSGTGVEPFVGRWDRLPPPGSTWSLRFAITVRDQLGAVHDAEVAVAVRVLSPAIAL